MLDSAHKEAAEIAAFVRARALTGRNAWRLWCDTHGVDRKSAEAVAKALPDWHATQFLDDPNLYSLALRVLTEARGRRVDGSQKFPAVLWLGGAEDTKGGRDFLGTAADFVKLLHVRASVVAPKRTGWVVEPTTNPKGRRTNEETRAIHALFLDCDATGDWNELLQIAETLDLAFIAYQSGGWTADSPKWRIVFFLHSSHETQTESAQNAWKVVYNHARVLFGALGKLRNVGFDPATETPCCPWFLTEKRTTSDEQRQLVAKLHGHTLDLTTLALLLPQVAEEDREEKNFATSASDVRLDEEKLNEIINALVAVTSSVPTGRRDLYLALPGALLDRGVHPEDVYDIIEAVSASYPRQHPEKHADNLHSARTTIGKWEASSRFTRIGTLQACAPHVAAAVDKVLPSAAEQLAATTRQMLTGQALPIPAAQHLDALPIAQPRRVRKQLVGIAKDIAQLGKELKTLKKNQRAVSGLVIENLVDGVPLRTDPHTSPAQVDEMIAGAMREIGKGLPVRTLWSEVLDFAAPFFTLMGVAQSKERVMVSERAFYEGKALRNKRNVQKQALDEKRKTIASSVGVKQPTAKSIADQAELARKFFEEIEMKAQR